MKKISDVMSCVGMTIFMIIIWCYGMLVSSDSPVNVTFNELLTILILLVVFLIIYSLYVRKTRYPIVNLIFLLFPLGLWYIGMTQSLKYNYHPYTKVVDISGFFISLIAFVQCIIRKFKNIKRNRDLRQG